jgi:hypothetical protein
MMERKPSAIGSPSQAIQETWQPQSQLKYHVFSFSIALSLKASVVAITLISKGVLVNPLLWQSQLYYCSRFDLIMKPQSQ